MKGEKRMKPDSYIMSDADLPLREVVFNTLRKNILRGDLKPGERLMEIQLANKLGVSRTPVREAIRKLELEGLVLMIPRRGAEVAKITEKNLRDALEIRRTLEKLAVSLACARITDQEMDELRRASNHCGTFLNKNDLMGIAKADEEFHNVIYRATDNQKLIKILNNLSEQVYRYRVEYLKHKETPAQIINEHKKLIKAIEERDVERASEIAAVHIDNQVKSVADKLRSETTI
jgi:DNA-binding GntR family transcriptional regulator